MERRNVHTCSVLFLYTPTNGGDRAGIGTGNADANANGNGFVRGRPLRELLCTCALVWIVGGYPPTYMKGQEEGHTYLAREL